MSTVVHDLRDRLTTRAWRLAQLLGPAGWVGVALLTLASIMAGWAIHQQQRTADVVIPPAAQAPVGHGDSVRALPTAQLGNLPQRTDIPQILASMQEACRKAGLAWPQAEYRHFDASKEQLPQLEVQTVLKGSYAQIKALVEALLRQHPALGLRTWSMERPNADTGVAEAKLVWVLYLRDGPEGSGLSTAEVP